MNAGRLLQRFIAAHEQADPEALITLLTRSRGGRLVIMAPGTRRSRAP
jgi:hypothetical protein